MMTAQTTLHLKNKKWFIMYVAGYFIHFEQNKVRHCSVYKNNKLTFNILYMV